MAVKKVDVAQLKKNKEDVHNIIFEAEMLRGMNHENIIGFVDLKESGTHLYIVTEWANMGTFRQLISERPHLLTPDHGLSVLR